MNPYPSEYSDMDTPQHKEKPRGIGKMDDDPKRIEFSATVQKKPLNRPNNQID